MLFIFDFDGTLLDSMPVYTEIAVDVFEKYIGVDKQTATADYINSTGLSFKEQLKIRTSDDGIIDKANKEFHTRKNALIDTFKLFPEVKETFKTLKEQGHKIAIISSNSHGFIKACVTRLELDVDWYSGVGTYKDKGWQYWFCQTEIGMEIPPIYIGDSKSDEYLAGNLKVSFIGIARNDYVKFEGKTIKDLSELCQLYQTTGTPS